MVLPEQVSDSIAIFINVFDVNEFTLIIPLSFN